jgi:hypothetical protein
MLTPSEKELLRQSKKEIYPALDGKMKIDR